jgi:hypothetical protein
MGRPSDYSPEITALICERMAKGESLRSICKDEAYPAESTVRLWAISDRDGFSAQYARAREAQIEALSEDILEIADDKTGDPQRDRLRVDSRKWLMSKIAPKKYGDKVGVEMSGSLKVTHEEALEQLE